MHWNPLFVYLSIFIILRLVVFLNQWHNNLIQSIIHSEYKIFGYILSLSLSLYFHRRFYTRKTEYTEEKI